MIVEKDSPHFQVTFDESTVTVNPTKAATFVLTKLLGKLVFHHSVFLETISKRFFVDLSGSTGAWLHGGHQDVPARGLSFPTMGLDCSFTGASFW